MSPSIAPLVQSESASVGQVIAERAVVDLPLSGRNFTQLTTLTPGASTGNSTAYVNGSTVTANGMRNSNTIFMLNGVNITDQDFAGTAILPPPDAIQEFNVQTNDMDSALGLGGVMINVELKSGTNAWHGSVYEFLRNDAMDARNFFSATVPKLKQNQFGFTLGGPIRRDKTFVFAAYQGSRNRAGQTFNSVVPTAAMKTGDFTGLKAILDPNTGQPFPNNLIPANRISPQASFFLHYYPSPNTAQGTYSSNANGVNDADQVNLRVDHQFRAADTLKVTYTFVQPSVYAPGAFQSIGGVTTDLRHQVTGISEVHTFSPNIVNQFTAGYVRLRTFGSAQGLGTNYDAQAGIGGFELTSTAYPGFPILTPAGYATLGTSMNNALQPMHFRENNYNFRDLVTVARGRYFIEAGVDITRHSNFTTHAALSRGIFAFSGSYTGNAFGDFMVGIPFQGFRGFPRDLFGYFATEVESFVQDRWKVTPRLTVTAGLRYSLFFPPTALHNVNASVNPAANQIVVASDSQGHITTNGQQVEQFVLPLFSNLVVPSSKVGLGPSLRHMDTKDFGPRLGLAWQPGHGFVVRAGYGMLYSIYQGVQFEGTVAGANLPFFADQVGILNSVPAKTLANFFAPISLGNFNLPPVSPSQLNPDSPTPYFSQWNFTLQKVIGGVVSAEGAYVGSKGTHLSLSLPLNVPAPGPGAVQARRLNPTFAAGQLIGWGDNSSYNAFQGKLQTRSWQGLNLLATFTWSKALDYQSGDFQASPVQDPNNLRAERGPSGPAARHTMGAVYELPFLKKRANFLAAVLGGWELTSILIAQSGAPFTPAINTDPANTGNSKRPNRIGNGGVSDPTINRWFDVSAFTVPAAFTYGNSGLGILDGPTRTNWDFGLFKSFRVQRVSETAQIQFRGEFFNFTNMPHFGLPTASIQAPTAGRILSADAPRQIQFALKLIF